MVEVLGSGIALDEQLDFSVNSSGDLKSVSGSSELEKDLAFQMIISLSKYVGQPPSGNLNEKVAGTASRVARADRRVNSVTDSNVTYSRDRREITVEMTVTTRNAQRALVFNV